MDIVEYVILGLIMVMVSMIIFLFFDRRILLNKYRKIRRENVKNKDILNENLRFAENIGRGELDTNFDVSKDNVLGSALLKMKSNLLKVSEEDEHRNWVSDGLAKFANILRSDHDVFEMTDILISEVVKYMEVNQGSIFFVNEENSNDIYLELKACYAWERNKYANMRIELNEGLAGRCFMEQKKIVMTRIPDDYVTITSGIGSANPSNIVIIPIKLDEKIFGIIEIASFNVLENHHIEFLEKLVINIASIISNIKVNNNTQKLLLEMRDAKEAMEKAQDAVNAQLELLENVVSVSKTDLKGKITYANNMFLKTSGYLEEDLIGKTHSILKSGHTTEKEYTELWDTISSGKTWKGEFKNITKNGSSHWSDVIIAPLKNSNKEIFEYMSVSFPINEKKLREEKMDKMLVRLEDQKKKTEAILDGAIDGVLVLSHDARIEYVNLAGQELIGDISENIVNKRVFEFLPLGFGADKSCKSLVVLKTNHEVNIRTELTFLNTVGEAKDVLISSSEFDFAGEKRCALFLQNITVDLF